MMPAIFLNLALIFAFLTSPSTLCNGLMRKLNSETDPIVLTCRKVTDFGFCVYTLRSDPRSAGANVDGLAHIALDILGAHAKYTWNCLHELQKSATVEEKQVVGTCMHFYDLAIYGEVPTAVKFLYIKAYGNARKAALVAMNDEEGCQQVMKKDPSAKWQMPIARNVYMHDLCLLSSDLIGLLN